MSDTPIAPPLEREAAAMRVGTPLTRTERDEILRVGEEELRKDPWSPASDRNLYLAAKLSRRYEQTIRDLESRLAAPRVETEGDAARGVVVVGEDDPRGLLVTIRFPDKANVTIGQHVTARFAPYVAVDPKEGT